MDYISKNINKSNNSPTQITHQNRGNNSVMVENPQLSIKISLTGFDDLKPKLIRPFYSIVSEDETQLRVNYERLNMYPELSGLNINDIIDKY